MQQQPSSPASNRASLALMAAILCFGVGSAYMVLRKPEAASLPRSAAPAPVPTASQPAPLPSEAPAALAAHPASAAVSVAPAVSAAVAAPSASAPQAVTAPPPVAAAPAAPSPTASAANGAKPLEPKSVKPVTQPKRMLRDTDAEPSPRPRAADGVPADWKQTKREPVVRVLDQQAAPVVERSTSAPVSDKAADPVVDRPADKAGDKPAPAPVTPLAASAPRPAEGQATRAVIAEPLVREKEKPTVVMATAQKAWVRIDDKLTIIIHKGEQVQGLGTFQGFDGKAAKFDSGTFPVSSGSN